MLLKLWKEISFFLTYSLNLPYWVVHPIRDWKRRKLVGAFPPGTLVETCNYHPAIITENDDGDLTCFDLVTQRGGFGCSLFHCGIVELSQDEVHKLIELYKEGGDRALMLNSGWTEADIDKFNADWRR